MPAKEFMEIRAVPTGKTRGATHVAARAPKDLFEVGAVKGLARFAQRGKRSFSGVVPRRNQHDWVLILCGA